MPERYEVVLSGHVREELDTLIARAKLAGRESEFESALVRLNERLQVYPQFGEAYRDSQMHGLLEIIGVVEFLVARYILDEARKRVYICVPLRVLRNAGI